MGDSSPQRRRRGRSGFVLFVLFVVIGLTAQTAEQNPDLQKIRDDISRLRDKLQDVKSKTETAERDLEEVSIELEIRSRELDIANRVEASLEAQQHATENNIAELTLRIAEQKHFLRQRLAALYRLGRLSYVRLLLSVDDQHDPLQAVSMLTYLASRDSRAISRFDASRRELRSAYEALAVKKRSVSGARAIVQQRQQAVAATYARQQRLVAALHHQSAQSEQQIAALEEKAVRLERLIDVLQKQSAGAPVEADIRSVQGALGWPVEGKVLETFGRQVNPKFSTVTFNNGLKIGAAPGAEVRAVFPGTVLFSQWFKGYGNLIIVDHGNRVVSLYGNLKSPSVAVGDHVRAGQTIAGVGEAEDAQAGYLYFEIRQDNKPEDPQKWLR
jgi:septal ring factor EnvC (AmiA/AmiB activator)